MKHIACIEKYISIYVGIIVVFAYFFINEMSVAIRFQDDVTYTLVDASGDGAERFYLEQNSGNIMLVKSLIGGAAEYNVGLRHQK